MTCRCNVKQPRVRPFDVLLRAWRGACNAYALQSLERLGNPRPNLLAIVGDERTGWISCHRHRRKAQSVLVRVWLVPAGVVMLWVQVQQQSSGAYCGAFAFTLTKLVVTLEPMHDEGAA